MIKRIFVTRIINGKKTQKWEDFIEEKIEDIERKEKEKMKERVKLDGSRLLQ